MEREDWERSANARLRGEAFFAPRELMLENRVGSASGGRGTRKNAHRSPPFLPKTSQNAKHAARMLWPDGKLQHSPGST